MPPRRPTTSSDGDESPRRRLNEHTKKLDYYSGNYDQYVAERRVRDDEQSHWASLAGLVQFDALGGGSVATPPCAADDEACLAAPDECLVPAVSR